MADFENDDLLPLGKVSEVPNQYDPKLLYLIPRSQARESLPKEKDPVARFYGEDIWTAYELSWLDLRGKPVVAIAKFHIPCDSACIVESKSLKLYLNSFYLYRAESPQEIRRLLSTDLDRALDCEVDIELCSVDGSHGITDLAGQCLDQLEVAINCFEINSQLLKSGGGQSSEVLYSHLLRSTCPVTGQPDWGSVIIKYRGQSIDHKSLLAYLVSFRDHQGFHEQCVERIYLDLQQTFRLDYLSVYARYLRRGGLDINPYRSSEDDRAPLWRLSRQ
jgi:7-cyano-7-deazaguanine reductase